MKLFQRFKEWRARRWYDREMNLVLRREPLEWYRRTARENIILEIRNRFKLPNSWQP